MSIRTRRCRLRVPGKGGALARRSVDHLVCARHRGWDGRALERRPGQSTGPRQLQERGFEKNGALKRTGLCAGRAVCRQDGRVRAMAARDTDRTPMLIICSCCCITCASTWRSLALAASSSRNENEQNEKVARWMGYGSESGSFVLEADVVRHKVVDEAGLDERALGQEVSAVREIERDHGVDDVDVDGLLLLQLLSEPSVERLHDAAEQDVRRALRPPHHELLRRRAVEQVQDLAERDKQASSQQRMLHQLLPARPRSLSQHSPRESKPSADLRNPLADASIAQVSGITGICATASAARAHEVVPWRVVTVVPGRGEERWSIMSLRRKLSASTRHAVPDDPSAGSKAV
eukprot:1292771-Rhodomonas_salina.5